MKGEQYLALDEIPCSFKIMCIILKWRTVMYLVL